MFKKISKIITIGIFLFLVFGLFSITNIKTIQAEKFVPNVPIPGATDIELSKSTKPIAEYMKALYTWGIGVVGVLAGVVLVIAGIIWLTAGGNNTQVETAKKWIAGSLSGLVLALGSYFLLYQINPDLVSFKYYTIPGVETNTNKIKTGCCKDTSAKAHCMNTTEKACVFETMGISYKGSFSAGHTCINNQCYKYAGDGESTLMAERCEPGLKFIGDPVLKCSEGKQGSPCLDDKDCSFSCTSNSHGLPRYSACDVNTNTCKCKIDVDALSND